MTKLSRAALMLFILAITLTIWYLVRSRNGDKNYLFQRTERSAVSPSQKDEAVVSTINAVGNLNVLSDSPDEFIVPLPGEADMVAIRSTTDSADNFTNWIGLAKDDPYSWISLTYGGDFITGSIVYKKKQYRIQYASDGVYQIAVLNPDSMSDDTNDADVPVADTSSALFACDNPEPKIRVLVVYTADAETGAGGAAPMTTLVNHCISLTNQSFSNSGVTYRIELAQAARVVYTESASAQTDRNALQNQADGKLDDVHALRDKVKADVVLLIVEKLEPKICGKAYIMDPVGVNHQSYAFAVVKRSCAADNKSFPHELGHIMGLRHESASDPAITPYPYAHGYQVAKPADPAVAPWRTIMSRSTGIRMTYFSNPTIKYPTTGTGTKDPMGTANSADNHRVLNQTAPVVSRFRCK